MADACQPCRQRRPVIPKLGSLQSKRIIMALSTTLVVLVLASMAMLLVDLRTAGQFWVDDLGA